jgi:hypothetical protein
VLHVFESACNLISADGQVISLVIESLGDGPFSLVVPPMNFFNYIIADMPATVDRAIVQIGDLEIDTSTARVWEARPPWEALRRSINKLMACLPLITSALCDTAPAESFARFVVSLPETGLRVEEEMLRAAQSSIEKMVNGLQCGDFILCAEGAAGLTGLGTGFTPDGDDFLLGCVLAAWIKLTHTSAETFAMHITDAAAKRTTPLSRAWLNASARGECALNWHLLLENLLGGKEDAILRSVKDISEQGHTSGASALAGFLTIMAEDDYHPSLQ